MAALTQARLPIEERFRSVALPMAAQVFWQGGRACWDTSTGTIKKAAAASATLVPVGLFGESGDNTGGLFPNVLIILDKEISGQWFDNDTATPVAAGNLGGNCWLLDDHTVTGSSSGNSVAGRAWKLDSVKGVLVQAGY